MTASEIKDPEIQESKIQEEKALEAYFKKIKYDGDKNPSLETLRKIHFLHPQVLPFENLNPFLTIPVLLDDRSIQQKMIFSDRGGYCFEHNLLLGGILKEIGFKVTQLAARIMWKNPEEKVTAKGHMLLLVQVEDRLYLADVGFGGLTLTAPLLLQPEIEQSTPHEIFRLLKDGEYYILQALIKNQWKASYKFTLEEQFLPDYQVSSWYLSNHPESHFVTGLIAARTTAEGRYNLHDQKLSIHSSNGRTEKREFTSPEALEEILRTFFSIRLPENFKAIAAQKIFSKNL